jgi:phage gpG-like protein
MQQTVLTVENRVKTLMTGPRSGRWYRIGKTPTKQNRAMGQKTGRWYQASAPGEPPAIKTSRLFKSVTHRVERRLSDSWVGMVGTNVPYAPYLEFGVKADKAKQRVRTYRVTQMHPETGQPIIAKVKGLSFAGGWRLAPRPLWRRAVTELRETITKIWQEAGEK